jgi:hypothetical protein
MESLLPRVAKLFDCGMCRRVKVDSFDINIYSLALSPNGTCIAAGCARRFIDTDGDDGSNNIRVINLELAKISHPYISPGWEGA